MGSLCLLLRPFVHAWLCFVSHKSLRLATECEFVSISTCKDCWDLNLNDCCSVEGILCAASTMHVVNNAEEDLKTCALSTSIDLPRGNRSFGSIKVPDKEAASIFVNGAVFEYSSEPPSSSTMVISGFWEGLLDSPAVCPILFCLQDACTLQHKSPFSFFVHRLVPS